MSPSTPVASCRVLRRLWPLLLACTACDPLGGGDAGPREAWFRGPDEYLEALEARTGFLDEETGALGDPDDRGTWTALLSEGRPLRITVRAGGAEPERTYTYYGDGVLAAIRLVRLTERDGGADTTRLSLDFAGDTLTRLRWRGAAVAGAADSTTWPDADLARIEARARRRLAAVDSILNPRPAPRPRSDS